MALTAIFRGVSGKQPKVDGEIVNGHHSYSASQYPHLANKGEYISSYIKRAFQSGGWR